MCIGGEGRVCLSFFRLSLVAVMSTKELCNRPVFIRNALDISERIC